MTDPSALAPLCAALVLLLALANGDDEPVDAETIRQATLAAFHA